MICNHCGEKVVPLKYSNPAEYKRRKAENAILSVAKARANGTRMGKKRKMDYEKIRELRAKGLTFREISIELNCSTSPIQAALGRR